MQAALAEIGPEGVSTDDNITRKILIDNSEVNIGPIKLETGSIDQESSD